MITVTFRTGMGRQYDARGKTIDSVIQREFGRTAIPQRSADENEPRFGRVIRTDRHGTHVLATIVQVKYPRFSVGDRVELHPGTDAWMAGDRLGTVERIGRDYYHVAMQLSGRLLRVAEGRMRPIGSTYSE